MYFYVEHFYWGGVLKTFLAIIVGLLACVFILSKVEPVDANGHSVKTEKIVVNQEQKEELKNKEVEIDSARQAVVEHFKTKEKIAKDSVWTSSTMFKVGVLDDGTPRDGYAQYVCEVLSDFGFKGKGVEVKIIDVAKLVRTDKWETLGSAQCK